MKRLYIPLPDTPARRQIVTNLMKQQAHSLTDEQFDQISEHTDGKLYDKYNCPCCSCIPYLQATLVLMWPVCALKLQWAP